MNSYYSEDKTQQMTQKTLMTVLLEIYRLPLVKNRLFRSHESVAKVTDRQTTKSYYKGSIFTNFVTKH